MHARQPGPPCYGAFGKGKSSKHANPFVASISLIFNLFLYDKIQEGTYLRTTMVRNARLHAPLLGDPWAAAK